ncbi:hypothetical protein B0H19DRAFT_15919 [Mycena capillaripes]|nr:hypothetical protein B0H19DRAFT_15919 [Mycena capillaripes]
MTPTPTTTLTSAPSTSSSSLALPDEQHAAAPNPKPKQSRLRQDRARSKLIADYFNNVTRNPTTTQYNDLLDQIHNLPGKWNAEYRLQMLRNWFGKERAKSNNPKPKRSPKPAPDPVNPLYPSLTTEVRTLLRFHFDLTDRDKHKVQTYEHWVTSASFEEYNSDQQDLRKWIAEAAREARFDTEDNELHEWIDVQLAPKRVPLRIDTQTTGAIYGSSLPTPSDTTSPEPQPLPVSASGLVPASGPRRSASISAEVRFHPYSYSYSYPYPPTPSSSRAQSIALKSESANSPLVYTHSTLPPVSAASSPSSFASTSSSAPPFSAASSTSSFSAPYTPSPSVSAPPSATVATHVSNICFFR